MAKIVNTTDEQVLAAAKACPTARETLKTLFPAVFEDDGLVSVPYAAGKISVGDSGSCVIEARTSGQFRGKGLYLPPVIKLDKVYPKVVWSVVTDNEDTQTLIGKIQR